MPAGITGWHFLEELDTWVRLLRQLGALDDDRLDRHVTVLTFTTGGHCGHRIDDFLALAHLAEDAVAPAILSWIVEEAVILEIDEELGAGAVRIRRAGHGEGALDVLEAVFRLVLDVAVGFLLLHVRSEAAALHHEVRDHAVEDQAVVKALLHILDEVGDADGSLGGVEFEFEGTFGGLHHDFHRFCVTHGLGGGCAGQSSKREYEGGQSRCD